MNKKVGLAVIFKRLHIQKNIQHLIFYSLHMLHIIKHNVIKIHIKIADANSYIAPPSELTFLGQS